MTNFEFYCCVGFFGLIMGLVVVAWVINIFAKDQDVMNKLHKIDF